MAVACVLVLAHGVGALPSFSSVVAPKITSLSAYDGAAGNPVAIFGTDLSGATTVKFGTVAVTPSSVTATEIDADVPLTGFSSGKVSVTTAGGTATSSQPFAITKITGFSPAAAVAGKIVTITGQGLGSTTAVDFVGHTDAPLAKAATATSVKVAVPDDAAVGDLFVETPNVPLGSVSTATSFKPLPSITSLSPPDGLFSTTVHIIGANFVNVGLVKIGKLDADNVNTVSATEVDADVPVASTGGTVSVQTLAGTAVSKTPFAITKVTGFTPLAAAAGKTITITGQGLSDVSAVDFVGHAGVVPTSTSPTSAKVVVPNDAIPGELSVHTPAVPGGLPPTATFKAIPTITGVTPVDGAVGTPVTITGSGFFTSVDTVVKFGTVVAPTYNVMSPTEIDTTIPSGFSSGKVTVITDGGTAISATTIALTVANSFLPTKAVAGQVVTITGKGLGSTTAVNFTGIQIGLITIPAPGTNVTATATSVKVTVPSLATVGPITVVTPYTTASTATFTPLPKLTGVSPSPSQAGGLVIVSGTNLEPTNAAPTATFNGGSIAVTVPSAGGFLTTLPNDAITGTLTVTTPTGMTSFKVPVSPTISGGPTPAHAAAGTPVTLTGLTFTGTTKVAFADGASAPFTVSGLLGSTQTLTFKVPASAKSGPITVTNAGGSTQSSSFTVDPVISSFTPVSGAVGATVTVNGTGFYGATSVTFGGGQAATPTSVTQTSLKVVVPPGVAAGHLVVHTGAGDSPASTGTFTPTATVSSFSPLAGGAGTPVEIAGAGFQSATQVKFGTIPVGHFTVANNGTTIDTTVPASATDAVITVVRSASPTNLASVQEFSVFSVTSLSSSDVHEGDTLTIHGTHLDHATNVTFNGGDQSVTPSNVTSTSIDVVVPAGVSTGTLSVTSDSDFADVTVTSPTVTIDSPEITGISFDSYDSNGSVLEIDGAGFVGASVTIGSDDVSAYISSETGHTLKVVLPGGFSFTSGLSGNIVVQTDVGDSSGSGTFTIYQHSNGVSSNFFDTLTPNTYTEQQALEAAQLWNNINTPGIAMAMTCSGDSALWMSEYPGVAVVWVWGAEGDATLQGHAKVASGATCPTSSDPSWG